MDYEYRTKVFLGLVDEKPKDGKMPTEKQLETLINYYNFRYGKSDKTIYEDIRELRLLALHTRKPFEKMNAIDLQKYIASRKVTKSYTNTIKKILLTFFKYVHNTIDEKPDCVKWIKFDNCQTDITPEDILSIEEINSMIKNARNQRDRTLIAVFYDSGCRIGELIENSKLGDVYDDERGFFIRVIGKTNSEGKSRKIRLKDSIPYLIQYLPNHPTRNPDDPLFMTNYNGGWKRMSNEQASTIIKNAAKDAKIKKHVFPHLLRHTRTSHISLKLSDQSLKSRQGWSKSSKMPERYVHASESMIDDSVCRALGIDIPEEKQTSLGLETAKCAICGVINPVSNYMCYNCKRILKNDERLEYQDTVEILKLEMEKNNKAMSDRINQLEKSAKINLIIDSELSEYTQKLIQKVIDGDTKALRMLQKLQEVKKPSPNEPYIDPELVVDNKSEN